MQEKENVQDAVTFLWNDVAVLGDENNTFIIIKALLALPPEKAEASGVAAAMMQDVLSEVTQQQERRMLTGEVLVTVGYECAQGQDDITFALPFEMEYVNEKQRGTFLQEKYIFAEVTDSRHLRVEAVLAMPLETQMRTEEECDDLEQQHQLTLPKEWPPIEEILGTKLQYQVTNMAESNVEGQCVLGILYATDALEGERVAYYEDEQPFTVQRDGADGVVKEICYHALTAQVQEEGRAVLIRSKSQLVRTAKAQENEEMFLPNVAEEVKTPSEDENEARQMRRSRREHLRKHMRHLEQGVKTSFVIRNIDLEKTQMEQEEK